MLRFTEDQYEEFKRRRALAVPDRRTDAPGPRRSDEREAGMFMMPPADSGIELRLPWPPSTNSIWRNVNGRTLLSAKARSYYQRVVPLIVDQRQGRYIAGRAHVEITLHAPTKRCVDIDNRVKIVLDAITKARGWDDDAQVDVITVSRGPVVRGGAAVVRVAEIDE